MATSSKLIKPKWEIYDIENNVDTLNVDINTIKSQIIILKNNV